MTFSEGTVEAFRSGMVNFDCRTLIINFIWKYWSISIYISINNFNPYGLINISKTLIHPITLNWYFCLENTERRKLTVELFGIKSTVIIHVIN